MCCCVEWYLFNDDRELVMDGFSGSGGHGAVDRAVAGDIIGSRVCRTMSEMVDGDC